MEDKMGFLSIFDFMRLRFFAFFILCSQVSIAQIGLKNETAYLTEVVYHTSQTDVNGTDFIGWLLNTTTAEFNDKHSLNIGLMLTHGGEPSANIVGDLQTFSNLEAGFLYGFDEVFYQYADGDFWLKIGQVDINSDFFVSENGLLYTHSSFGIDPATTVNLPAPTYPVVGASITGQVPITEKIKLRAGVFDGQFATPENSRLRIDWSLNSEEGLLYIIEPEFTLFKGRVLQKIGFYHHSGRFLDRRESAQGSSNQLLRGLSSFYSTTDIELKKWNQKESLHAFLQTNFSQRSISIIHQYFGFGIRGKNFIPSKRSNEIGIGIAYANVNSEGYNAGEWNDLAHETVLEITYMHQINPWLSLQPYFQYIGMREYEVQGLRNPIVAAMRANFIF